MGPPGVWLVGWNVVTWLFTLFICSFLAKKYKKVTGKEIYSDTLESTPMLEKEKFPQDYFPEVRPEPVPLSPRALTFQGGHVRRDI